ncbi:MAG: ectoine/hydroxyectoine ABC transporter permease subunit EhuD [Ardenticatenaceae bacterium]|nr:ectoine/hydroxyectoine ABC transporter permease subunit EhuD [Ardenticatenaceae bacterium]HBY92907.1 ectoine/hydroxyectoine ABC transporter permease subunit EhuD [Chloroflexota bacterium]
MEVIVEFIRRHTPPFSLEKFIQFLPELAKGAVVTVQVTLAGFALAMVLGLVIALARMSDKGWLRRPFTAFLEIIRNTPLLVQLYFAFWVLPSVGIRLPAFITGVTILGIHYGAYLSEVYRAGIQAVPHSQVEATVALNMTRAHAFRRIILPQAFRTIIPAMGNYLIGMFKDSAFVSAISIQEILARTRYRASTTFRFFELYTAAALFYFMISFPTARVVNAIERNLRRDLIEPRVGAPRGRVQGIVASARRFIMGRPAKVKREV